MSVAADAVAHMTVVEEAPPAAAVVVPKSAVYAPFFACRDIHAYYGESYVVQGISLELQEGEVLALLGRNGAGKTSTLRTIARASVPVLKHGEIYLGGKAIHPLRSFEAAQAGIQLVPEDRRIIGGLSVEDNLKLAQIAEPKGWPLERIYEHFPRLAERRKQEGTTLSGGEQQMLAVARALARDLKLLLLDEPYEGLAPVIVHEIEKIVADIKSHGITTVIVEQNAIADLQITEREETIGHGHVAAGGPADQVR